MALRLLIGTWLLIAWVAPVWSADESGSPCPEKFALTDLWFRRVGESQWIAVKRSDSPRTETFEETNRTREALMNHAHSEAGKKFFALETLKGKQVLDINAGTRGQWVQEMRAAGIDAVGVDLMAVGSEGLIRADATNLPFRDRSFDIIYSNFGLFWGFYIHPSTRSVRLAALKEVARVLRPGGRFRIIRMEEESLGDLEDLLQRVPGFRMWTHPAKGGFDVELERLP